MSGMLYVAASVPKACCSLLLFRVDTSSLHRTTMLLVTLYSPGCCKAQFLAQQHVDLSLEVPGGDAYMQLRKAYSFVPPSLRGAKALNMEFGVREGGSINMLARHRWIA